MRRATLWKIFLVVASAIFLVAFAVPILEPGIPHFWRRVCDYVQWLTWLVFVIDLIAQFMNAQEKKRWLLRHPLDVIVLALPIIRPLRVLRVVVMLRALNRTTVVRLRGRVATYVGSAALLLGFTAALTCLSVERNAPGSNIHTFGDAAWWTIATMTTVGYGDRFPVTTEGRFIGAALMLGGIALVGTVTATLASWFTEQVRRDDDQILEELRQLRETVEELRAHQK